MAAAVEMLWEHATLGRSPFVACGTKFDRYSLNVSIHPDRDIPYLNPEQQSEIEGNPATAVEKTHYARDFERKHDKQGTILVDDEITFPELRNILQEYQFASPGDLHAACVGLCKDGALAELFEGIIQKLDGGGDSSDGLRRHLPLSDAIMHLERLQRLGSKPAKRVRTRDAGAGKLVKRNTTPDPVGYALTVVKALVAVLRYKHDRLKQSIPPSWNICAHMYDTRWASFLMTLLGAAMQDVHVDGWSNGLSVISALEEEQSIIVLWNGYTVVKTVLELSKDYDRVMQSAPQDADPEEFWWHVVTKRLEFMGMGAGFVHPVRIRLLPGKTLVFHFHTPHCGDNRPGLRVHKYMMHADDYHEYATTPDLRIDDEMFPAIYSFDLGPQRTALA